jgi:DNA-binding MarR family transcriptional regulator
MGKDKAEPPAGPLDRSPSHLLHRALQRALDIYARSGASDGVTQRQFAVLAAVGASEGVTQTALVRATGIDRSTLADLVSRMIDKGFLARERSEADARANAVRLTEQGRLSLAEAEPRAEAADRAILDLLPSGKQDSFLKALEIVAGGAPSPKALKERAKAEKKSAKKERKRERKASEPDEPERSAA